MSNDTPLRLYLIYHEGGKALKRLDEAEDMVSLSDGLYLARTRVSRSKLYHAVKRRTQPSALLVGRLDEEPKFKGMAEGTTQWVRNGT